MKRKKGFYSISVVAKMFEVHQQTVRMYEKEGLLTPKRSAGNTRLFSEEDVDRLEEIIYLTHKVGVNLAGVEMILKLKKKISKLQEEINIKLNAAQENLDEETEHFKEDTKARAKRLLQMKQEAQKNMRDGFIEVQEVAEKVTGVVNKKRAASGKRDDVFELNLSNKRSKKDEKPEVFDDWQIEYDDDK